jgi:hypothetical protein
LKEKIFLLLDTMILVSCPTPILTVTISGIEIALGIVKQPMKFFEWQLVRFRACCN